MKITFDTKVLDKYNLSVGEYLLLLLNITCEDVTEAIKSIEEKNLAHKSVYDSNRLILSDQIKELVRDIQTESDTTVIDKDKWFEDVAIAIREIFPKGRKSGTTYMWRDTTAVIAKKLKTLVVKYNFTFTKEQAIKATTTYVESFHNDFKYMQLLKYFILKSAVNANGDTEIRSEFMSLIENEDDTEVTDNTDDDLLTELR
jgi:hypothetical protein